MTTMVSVVSGGSVVHAQKFAGARDGKWGRIAAVKGARYIVEEVQDGAAGDINVMRVGRNLVIEQAAKGREAERAVIEDFYGSEGQLFGVGADGQYLEYQIATEHGVADVSALSDGTSSSVTLVAGQSVATPAGFQFAEGSTSAFSAALSGVAAVAGGLALRNEDSRGGHGTKSAPVAAAFVANDLRGDAAAAGATPAFAEPALSIVVPESDVTPRDVEVASTAAVPFAIGDLPVIDKMMDNRGAITGVIENGGYTDDNYPVMTGRADPGVKVHIYRGRYLQGSVTADANGDWVFTPSTPFATGRHSITIIHEYPNTATSEESEPYVITVDRVAPAMPEIIGIVDDEGRITGTVSDQTITDDNRPTISGTAEANATVVVYDKGREIGSTKVAADGSWSFTPEVPLADGLHILSYSAVDRAGNASQQTDVTEFVVDTRPDKINIFVADDNVGRVQGEIFTDSITDDSTPTLMGSATAGGIVKIYEGDVLLGEVVADVDGTWQFTPSALSEGTHIFHATVTLVAKGESDRSTPFTLTVDLTQPEKASIEQVLDDVGAVVGMVERGQSTDDATPTLSGKAEKGSTVHIHDNGVLLGLAVADASGSWTFTPAKPLSDGSHVFTVAAEDAAGNLGEASDTFAITIDTIPAAVPTIDSVYDDTGSKTGNLISGDETDDYRPDISGTADASNTVVIRDNGIEIGRVQANAEGKWSFTPDTNLAEGSHRLAAEAITIDGKISLPSDRFDFSVVQNGDDHPRELGSDVAKLNATLLIDNSGSMGSAQMTPLKAALKQLAGEYLGAAGGQAITLTMLTMSNTTPVKFTFSSVTDADYTKYIAAVDALAGYGGPSYESALISTMNSVKADYLAGDGPGQVFILGDAENSLTRATADKWQAMLLDPTGGEVLANPIQSTPISFLSFPHGYDYSFHWVASGGKAIDMPTPDMLPEILLGSATGDTVVGNLLDNDVKLALDGNEYLTQITFEGGTFRIAPNNTLVLGSVPEHVKAAYNPETGLLTITTQSGSLLVYMHASAGHSAGDYTYKSKLVSSITAKVRGKRPSVIWRWMEPVLRNPLIST